MRPARPAIDRGRFWVLSLPARRPRGKVFPGASRAPAARSRIEENVAGSSSTLSEDEEAAIEWHDGDAYNVEIEDYH